MQTFTLTIRTGGQYGALTIGAGGESMPCRIETPDEDTIIIRMVKPPLPTMQEALDSTVVMFLDDYAATAREEKPSDD